MLKLFNSTFGGIVILDGPDGAGKTTLANKLAEVAEKQGYTPYYRHLGAPVRAAWDEHKEALLEYIRLAFSGKKNLVIADRYFMSEAIYGHIYRQGSEYPYAARHFDRLLYRYGALRVVCAPPVEYVVQTHATLKSQRAEMYSDGMQSIAQMYYDLWHGCDGNNLALSPMGDYVHQLIWKGGVQDKIGWRHYDVTADGQNMVHYCEDLLAELEDLRATYVDIGLNNYLTGRPHSRSVLLVGDASSREEDQIPFLSNEGSSVYLAKTLQRLEADESQICMVNVNDHGGLDTVAKIGQMCGRTIVLGKNAQRSMERYLLKYDAVVRHPQHARRFTHNDQSYANDLREAFAGMAGVY